MANAKIVIETRIKGENQVKALGTNLKRVGREAQVASKRLNTLKASAARATSAFAALGTTIKVGVVASLGAATIGLGKFVSDTFSAGNQVEQLQNRFQLLFGSVEEGGKAFDSLASFASKVPFSLEEIAQGSGNLAVISDDAKDLSKIMEITGNVAAATGLDFRQTAEQIQRSFAGGIASADVFRERGVRAMLGFEAGVKVSVEETKKRFFEVFGPGGEFGNATKLLANTLTGQVSMVQDKYFQFRSIVAKSFFEPLKQQIRNLNNELGSNQKQLELLAKVIGAKLATAFKNIEKGLRFLIANFDKLVLATKIFIGLKLGGVVAGITAQFLLMGKSITRVTGLLLLSNKRLRVFNILVRANPFGVLLTAIQLTVVGLVAFRDELTSVGSYISGKFKGILDSLRVSMRQFGTEADETNLDVFEEDLEQIRREVEGLTASYVNLTKAQKRFFGGYRTQSQIRADKFRKFEAPNPRADMRSTEKVGEEQRAKVEQFIREQTHKKRMQFNEIVRQAEAKHAKEQLGEVITYREALANVGIEAQGVADSISTTWINGLREGNSLLEITKNSFKNVLKTIAETMLKKSIEYVVELAFQALFGNRLTIEKKITKEKQKQLGLDTAKAAINMATGGGGGGGGQSFLGFSEGGIVPGGAPYTDRVPAMLTPGEVVVPRDKANNMNNGTSITNINVSGNLDQRAIDQIQAVITQSSAQVGGANRTYESNTRGVRGRNR